MREEREGKGGEAALPVTHTNVGFDHVFLHGCVWVWLRVLRRSRNTPHNTRCHTHTHTHATPLRCSDHPPQPCTLHRSCWCGMAARHTQDSTHACTEDRLGQEVHPQAPPTMSHTCSQVSDTGALLHLSPLHEPELWSRALHRQCYPSSPAIEGERRE